MSDYNLRIELINIVDKQQKINVKYTRKELDEITLFNLLEKIQNCFQEEKNYNLFQQLRAVHKNEDIKWKDLSKKIKVQYSGMFQSYLLQSTHKKNWKNCEFVSLIKSMKLFDLFNENGKLGNNSGVVCYVKFDFYDVLELIKKNKELELEIKKKDSEKKNEIEAMKLIHKEEIQELKKNFKKSLINQKETLNRNKQHVKKQINDLKKKMESNEKEKKTLQKKVAKFEKTTHQKVEIIKMEEQKVAQLRKEIEKHKKTISEKENQISQLKEKYSKLRDSNIADGDVLDFFAIEKKQRLLVTQEQMQKQKNEIEIMQTRMKRQNEDMEMVLRRMKNLEEQTFLKSTYAEKLNLDASKKNVIFENMISKMEFHLQGILDSIQNGKSTLNKSENYQTIEKI